MNDPQLCRLRVGRRIYTYPFSAQLVGTLILVLLLLAKMECVYATDMLGASAGEPSVVDTLIWTIGARGQGLIVIPLTVCLALTVSAAREDSLCYIVAFGTPYRYAAARFIEAMVIALVIAVSCYGIWLAVASSTGFSMGNWADTQSFYFASFAELSSIGALGAHALCLLGVLVCALYASVLFASIECLSGSVVVATACVMSVALLGFVSPSTNALFAFMPDTYVLAMGDMRMTWLTLPAACSFLTALALVCCGQKDYMGNR